MAAFNITTNATNTASTTVPMICGMATATNQIGIYDIETFSDATADNAVKYSVVRASARGTQSTAIVANAIDQNVTQAALTTWDTAWNIAPTLTASSQLLQLGGHQRATIRWIAFDYTKFLRTQAGTGKGLALLSVVVSSAFNAVFSIAYEE